MTTKVAIYARVSTVNHGHDVGVADARTAPICRSTGGSLRANTALVPLRHVQKGYLAVHR